MNKHPNILFILRYWLSKIQAVSVAITPSKEKIIAALDDCLLKEEEVLKGRSYWDTLEDPFPAWFQKQQ